MNIRLMALGLLLLPVACRRGEASRTHVQGEAQVVALAVRTEPAGATVRVNDLPRTWKTPCDIADYALQRGILNVELSLPEYETVRRTVSYTGEAPAILEVSLKPEGLAKAAEPKAPAPRVQEKPAPKPAPAPATAESREPEDEPAPAKAAPPAVPPSPGLPPGTRVRVVSSQLPVRVTSGKTLVADGSRPGEVLLPEGATEKILVEFLDPKTGLALGVVEVLPREDRPLTGVPVPAPAPVPADQLPASDRVGKVQLVHRVYGVFVKLEPGLQLEPGEEIVIMRDGREVARSKIIRMIRQDETYPDGAVMLPKTSSIKKGDEVLRGAKP